MLSKSKFLLIISSLLLSVCAKSGQDDFYMSLAQSASIANIEYYDLYHECLKNNDSKKTCTKNGESHSADYIRNLDVVRNGLLSKYRELYSSKVLPKSTPKASLSMTRDSFFHESTYLQRKLLIFIANIEKKCGRPESYQAVIDWSQTLMEYYVGKSSEVNEDYFSKYDTLMFDYVKKNESECKYYLQINSRLFHEVYADQVNGMKVHMNKEELLSLFVYSLIKDLADEEKSRSKAKQ